MDRYLSSLDVWAMAFGCMVGWGAFVMPGTSFLPVAGPAGTILAMVIGLAVMLVIASSVSFLMNRSPRTGGVYSYTKEAFGRDHAFLCSWFLCLSYLTIVFLNGTALFLVIRTLMDGVSSGAVLYTVNGNPVYLLGIFISLFALVGVGVLFIVAKPILQRLHTILSVILFAGVLVTALFCLPHVNMREIFTSFGFNGVNNGYAVFSLVILAPWAFVGFEIASFDTAHFRFPVKKSRIVLFAALMAAAFVYISLTVVSVCAVPDGYGSWAAYIADLGNQDGVLSVPTFYAAQTIMGPVGLAVMGVTALAAILTGIIGAYRAIMRVLSTMAEDKILSDRFSKTTYSILFIMALSILISLLGRNTLNWFIDLTAFGAIVGFGYTSAAATKLAKGCEDRVETWTGTAGLVICVGFGLYLLLPNLFMAGSIEPESFFLFVVWALLGFVYFHTILRHDGQKRFGKSIIVWIALLSLVLFVSLVRMSRAIMDATSSGLSTVEDYYTVAGISAETGVVSSQMSMIRQGSTRSIAVVVIVFALSLSILLNNYNLMSKRATRSELQLGKVRDLAYRDALTGLKNKLAFTEAEEEINGRITAQEQQPFAIVVSDVNGLKFINDTQGHKAGAEYIRSAGRLVCSLFMHSPVFRTGGDEFVVILTGRDYDSRQFFMAALHDQSVQNIGTTEAVVSGGLAEYAPEKTPNFHTVFEQADQKMYQEKQLLKSMGAATRS